MEHIARKPVVGVCNQVMLTSVGSATEISKNIETS